jgi:hypothetical protein
MYVEGNPINSIDPSGNKPVPPRGQRCSTMAERVRIAENYGIFSKTDFMNTYTAAGLGVQCAGNDERKPGDEANSGVGIAQVTDNQAKEAYGNIVIGNRGGGVRCYIKSGISSKKNPPCTYCFTKDEISKMNKEHDASNYFAEHYFLEPVHDQTDPSWAEIYMRRRIQQAVSACKKCTATDRFIVAALAQNGPGFTVVSAKEISSDGSKTNNKFRLGAESPIDWEGYIGDRLNTKNPIRYAQNWWDTRHQLDLFGNVAWSLYNKGWVIEDNVDWTTVWKLAK